VVGRNLLSTFANRFLSPEEYLEIERQAEDKNEYYKGEMFAMSGASRRHDRIATQLTFLIAQHLRGKRCEEFSANMRVLATPSGLYTYPDLSVACDEPQFADPHVDTLTNPTLLVEVLSPSTEAYDRGKKAKLYRAIPSLQELLFIAQESYEVELYRRQPDGTWSLIEARGLESAIALTSIGYTLSLRELYERVLGDSENAGS
jgi:Uma2 family endonuclease